MNLQLTVHCNTYESSDTVFITTFFLLPIVINLKKKKKSFPRSMPRTPFLVTLVNRALKNALEQEIMNYV